MSTLWFALGGVLVVIAVIWFIAYSRGQSLEKAKADRQLGQIADTKVSDPLKGGDPKQIPQNPNLVVPRPAVDGPRAGTTPGQPVSPGQTAPGSGRPASPATAGAGSGGGTQGTLAPVAEFGQDPRQSGLNYLLVEGQLDRESAEKIFQYLAENGVPAFAMVDDRGGAGNNPARYLVGVARGFNRDDYRGPARAELETRIKRLGQVWQSQRKGSTDFSRFGWARKN